LEAGFLQATQVSCHPFRSTMHWNYNTIRCTTKY